MAGPVPYPKWGLRFIKYQNDMVICSHSYKNISIITKFKEMQRSYKYQGSSAPFRKWERWWHVTWGILVVIKMQSKWFVGNFKGKPNKNKCSMERKGGTCFLLHVNCTIQLNAIILSFVIVQSSNFPSNTK